MIHLRLFGPIELRNDRGTDLHSVLAHSKHIALLAYLAVASRGMQRRDRLTALLWPELDDARARNALSKALHHLRHAVGEKAIVTRGNEEVGLNSADWDSDVAAFEQAADRNAHADALGIYGRGELLDGFHVSDAPEFENWLESARTRLRERAARSASALTTAAEASNDLAAAQKWSSLTCALSPYDEVALRRHLALLDRMGDRAGAISAYQTYAERHARELDAELSPETRNVVEAIRARAEGSSITTPEVARQSIRRELAPTQRVESPLAPPAELVVAAGASIPTNRIFNRNVMFALAALGFVGVAITLAISRSKASTTTNANRVLVSALENRTGDVKLASLGNMAADWITEGLQETGLTEIVDPVSTLMASRQVAPDTNLRTSLDRADAMARQAGADIVVWGAVYRERDSLIYRVQITDIKRKTQIAAIEPVTASLDNVVDGANKLRSKVAGALASALDQSIASVSAPSSRPPSFEAYKEYVLGLEAFALRSGSEALPHFEAASRLDPDFAAPLVWSIFSYENDGRTAERDSVIRLLNAQRARLRPLDRYALQYFLAKQRNDRNGQFDAARAAAKLSPGSEWSHNAAYIALEKNRPAEALTYLRQIDPEHGWARSWGPYWRNYTNALHLTHLYDEELLAAQRIRRITPTDNLADVVEARALVGLGRAEEGERLYESVLLLTHESSTWPGRFAYNGAQELSTHGYPELAGKLWRPTMSWFREAMTQTLPKSVKDTAGFRVDARHGLAQVLYETGRDNEARRIFRELAAKDSTDIDAWSYLGLIAAHWGDRAEAESILTFLTTSYASEHEGYRPAVYLAAELSAVLGKRDQAVDLIQTLVDKATLVGLPLWLHREPEWAVLRDYPPFQKMIRPDK